MASIGKSPNEEPAWLRALAVVVAVCFLAWRWLVFPFMIVAGTALMAAMGGAATYKYITKANPVRDGGVHAVAGTIAGWRMDEDGSDVRLRLEEAPWTYWIESSVYFDDKAFASEVRKGTHVLLEISERQHLDPESSPDIMRRVFHHLVPWSDPLVEVFGISSGGRSYLAASDSELFYDRGVNVFFWVSLFAFWPGAFGGLWLIWRNVRAATSKGSRTRYSRAWK
jgi:hypothetical protein